jgi:hypothetical protein
MDITLSSDYFAIYIEKPGSEKRQMALGAPLAGSGNSYSLTGPNSCR